MNALGQNIEKIVRQAVALGATEVLDQLRETLTEESGEAPAYLEWFEFVWEHEVSMSAVRKVARMIEEAGDKALAADFAVLVHMAKYRWEVARQKSKAKLHNRRNVGKRWERQRSELRHAWEISKAKQMMAVGEDRNSILDKLVGPASSKTTEERARLSRVLLKAGALPRARRKRPT